MNEEIERLLNKINWEMFVTLRETYLSARRLSYTSFNAQELKTIAKKLLESLDKENLKSTRSACLLASKYTEEFGVVIYSLEFCVGEEVYA